MSGTRGGLKAVGLSRAYNLVPALVAFGGGRSHLAVVRLAELSDHAPPSRAEQDPHVGLLDRALDEEAHHYRQNERRHQPTSVHDLNSEVVV